MAEYPAIVLTNAGLDMIAESQTGRSLIFTKLKIGDGLLGEGESISVLTALKSPKLDIPIQGLVNQGNGQVRLRYLIDNSGVPANQGFFAREVGIYAKIDEAGTERLYAYANGGNKVDWIPDKNTPMDAQIFDIFVLIGNASNVTVVIDGSATYATLLDVEEHNEDASAHAAAISQHNTSLTAHKDLLHLWQPGHTYAVGDIAYSAKLPSWAYLECVQAGTSGTDDNIFTDISSGGVISDNSVRWAVRDLRAGTAVGKIPALIDIGSGVPGLPRVSGAVPPGMIGFFSISTPPTGWLKANGAAVSRTAYAALFAVLGTYYGAGDGSTTFNLPELRGEFIRGWDDGRGVDSGRAFGIVQGHALQEHNHYLPTSSGTGNDRWGIPDTTWVASDSNEYPVTGNGPAMTFPGHNVGNFASETRPRNQALLACIKY